MTGSSAVEVARRTVEVLLGAGVTDAVLAPGSRSGPLALALHAADAQHLVRLHVRIDEREAGFVALGLSRASGRPVPVVTTSGTAVVNLHPAMLEAWHAGVEVVAITADRPERLRGTGANQTTDQRGVLAPVATVESLADLTWGTGGPVHLNLAFDEPLVEPVDWTFSPNRPTTPAAGPPAAGADRLVLAPGPRTVVVAGDSAPTDVAEVARRAGWPIIAEPSSNLRAAPTALATGRLLLGSPTWADRIERVVSLGHATVSRPVAALLARADLDVVHVGDQTTFPVPAGPRVRWATRVAADEGDDAWAREWIAADERLSALVPEHPAFTVARAVWAAAGPDGLLTLGPSQILRDVDLVAPARQPAPRVLANRGLAGIDGVVSSAVGATLAHGGPGIAYLGDLTFVHGSNGLVLGGSEPRPDLTLVVLNDDGGAIFSGLEQGAPEYAGAFERVYATATGVDLGLVTRATGADHLVVTPDEVADVLSRPAAGLRVVEVRVSRAERRELARTVGELVSHFL